MARRNRAEGLSKRKEPVSKRHLDRANLSNLFSAAGYETGPVTTIALVAALALAALLRFYCLDHGLPAVVYVDSFKFVDEAARMASTGDFNPKEFQYPGFFTNLLALLYLFSGVKTVYWQHLTAHIVSALAGIGLVGATFRIARSVTGGFGAFAASILGAVCVTSLTESRTPSPDASMACLMTVALLLLLSESKSVKRFALAGVLTGLAAGMKWTGLYLLPWIAAAAWVFESKQSTLRILRKVAITLFISAAAFVIATPWLVVSLGRFMDRFVLELEIQRYGQVGRVQTGYFDYWLSTTPTWEQPWIGASFAANYGVLTTIFILGALLYGLAGRGGKKVTFLAAFAAVYLILISGPGRLRAFRFLLPVLPVCFVLVGWFIDSVLLPRIKRYPLAAGGVLLGALLVYPAGRSVSYLARMRETLANNLAREWVASNVAAGTTLFSGPFFTGDLRQLPLKVVYLPNPGSRQYRVPGRPEYNGELDPIYHPRLLADIRGAGIRYIILNSYFDNAFSPIPENLLYFPRSVAGYREFKQRLNSEADRLYSVSGWSEGRWGPDISVYHLK